MFETLKGLIAVFILVSIALLVPKIANILASMYENHVENLIYTIDNSVSEGLKKANITQNTVNVSDYDLYNKTRSSITILDAAMAIAVLAMIAAVLIYNRVRV